MEICLSEVTTLKASFAEDVEACCGNFSALEVWLTKLEQHLEQHSLSQTKALLADKGVRLAAAAYQGGLLLSQGEQRKVHFDDFRRRLELCQALNIRTLLVVADFAQKIDAIALQRSVVSLKQAGQWAAGFDIRLALEFRSASSFCASLDTAVKLTAACAEPNVGVCLDSFHFFTGPSKEADLSLLDSNNLFWVQISDLAGVPRELASDADRVLPADGDLPIASFLQSVRDRGYNGWVSLELMNPTLWQLKASQIAELAAAAMQRVLPK